MLTEAKSAKRARDWCEMLERALQATGVAYQRLASKHLVGCFLAVYARREPRAPGGLCASKCRDVDVAGGVSTSAPPRSSARATGRFFLDERRGAVARKRAKPVESQQNLDARRGAAH